MTASYEYTTKEYAGHYVDRVRFVRQHIGYLAPFKRFASRDMGDEDPFHLYMEAQIRNPLTGEKRVVRLEKDPTVKGTPNAPGGVPLYKGKADAGREVKMGALAGKITLGEMRQNVERHYRDVLKKPIEKYSLGCSNCQMFGIDYLEASGIAIPKDVRKWADQEAGTLVPKAVLPVVDAMTSGLAWWSNNVKDKFFYTPPSAPLRKNHTDPSSLPTPLQASPISPHLSQRTPQQGQTYVYGNR